MFAKYPIIFTIIITSLYGVSDEVHQYFVPNRECEVLDWAADFIGIVITSVIIKLYLQKKFLTFKRVNGLLN